MGSGGDEVATCIAAFTFKGLPHQFVKIACRGASADGGVESGMMSRSLTAKLVWKLSSISDDDGSGRFTAYKSSLFLISSGSTEAGNCCKLVNSYKQGGSILGEIMLIIQSCICASYSASSDSVNAHWLALSCCFLYCSHCLYSLCNGEGGRNSVGRPCCCS